MLASLPFAGMVVPSIAEASVPMGPHGLIYYLEPILNSTLYDKWKAVIEYTNSVVFPISTNAEKNACMEELDKIDNGYKAAIKLDKSSKEREEYKKFTQTAVVSIRQRFSKGNMQGSPTMRFDITVDGDDVTMTVSDIHTGKSFSNKRGGDMFGYGDFCIRHFIEDDPGCLVNPDDGRTYSFVQHYWYGLLKRKDECDILSIC